MFRRLCFEGKKIMNILLKTILEKLSGSSSIGKIAAKKFLGKLFWFGFYVILVLLIFVAAQRTVQSEIGKELVGGIIGEIPFGEQLNSILETVVDYGEEVKETTEQFAADSVLVSLCKTLFMVWITPLFELLTKKVPDIIVLPIDSKTASRGLARMLKLALKCLEFVVRLVLTVLIFDPIKEGLDAFDPTVAMVVALTFFTLLFLLVGFCRAVLNGTTAESGVIRSYVADILPGLFEIFVSNSLCLWLYVMMIQHPYGWQPLVIFLALLFWFVKVQEPVKKGFKKIAEKLLRCRWRSSSVSVGQFVLWVLCSFSTMVLLYAMILLNVKDDSVDRLFSFSSFPFVSALLQDQLIGDLFLSFDPDFWTGFFLLVIVCAVTALLLKKPLGRNLGGAAGYLAAAGAVSAAGVLANMALQWLLAVDSELETNRYNGTAGIFFFLIFIALLLYHYQLIIAAAVTAALLMCAMQGIVLAGGSFGVFLEKAPGGQFWIASMVVILASAAVGALTYALRKK